MTGRDTSRKKRQCPDFSNMLNRSEQMKQRGLGGLTTSIDVGTHLKSVFCSSTKLRVFQPSHRSNHWKAASLMEPL